MIEREHENVDRSVVAATLLHTLGELDDAVNYRAWILALAGPHLAGPILEVGAGHGSFTRELVKFGRVHALEPDPDAFALLAERSIDDPRVDVTHGGLDAVPADPIFGSAVMINVLEHIADDHAALEQVAARTVPGGRLAIWVPAFQLLYSEFDRELGHHRRYRKKPLAELVGRSGWDVEDARYVNLPGWFSWLLITRLMRQRPTTGRLVDIFDTRVVPIVRALESKARAPFGQSILLIARKPAP